MLFPKLRVTTTTAPLGFSAESQAMSDTSRATKKIVSSPRRKVWVGTAHVAYCPDAPDLQPFEFIGTGSPEAA